LFQTLDLININFDYDELTKANPIQIFDAKPKKKKKDKVVPRVVDETTSQDDAAAAASIAKRITLRPLNVRPVRNQR
jgi:hypothetical protein